MRFFSELFINFAITMNKIKYISAVILAFNICCASAQSNSYRLFSPLAYYPSVNDESFRGNGDDSDIQTEEDNALRHIYMNRPDLVETSVSELHESASKASDMPAAPVKREIDVVKEELPVIEELPQSQPVEIVVKKPNFWTFNGEYSLQFMQNFFSDNWYQGGESNLAANASVKLKLNYDNKKKLKIENTLEMKLGFRTAESDSLHTFLPSSDMLRYTGKVGLQASKHWYYTMQTIATTQFAYGLKSNDRKVYSDFCSPLTVNVSLGMDYNVDAWKGKLKGSVHLAPLAYNWKHVSRVNLASRNGIREGHHSLEDYGSQTTINLTWKPSDVFKWDSRVYWFTSYKRTEIQWENTLNVTLSKYISAKLYLYPRFDDGAKKDDDMKYFQFKEYFSLGFNYSM